MRGVDHRTWRRTGRRPQRFAPRVHFPRRHPRLGPVDHLSRLLSLEIRSLLLESFADISHDDSPISSDFEPFRSPTKYRPRNMSRQRRRHIASHALIWNMIPLQVPYPLSFAGTTSPSYRSHSPSRAKSGRDVLLLCHSDLSSFLSRSN